MNTDPIQTGDLVQLKSGGPLMTVTAITPAEAGHSEGEIAHCAWFVPGNHADTQRGTFPAVTLWKKES